MPSTSTFGNIISMAMAMTAIPTISMAGRAKVNRVPSAEFSKSSMGILVVDQAPIKIRMLVKLAPFFMSTAATGKAP